MRALPGAELGGEATREEGADVTRGARSRVASPRERGTFLALELGSDVLNRRLWYVNVATAGPDVAPLRTYDLPTFAFPKVRVELFPLALSRSDALAGLGLEATFGINPLLRSRAPDGAELFATSTVTGEATLRWDLIASPAFPLVVAPLMGFRVQSFVVAPSASSAKFMPDLLYVSLRAGLGLEIPLVNDILYFVGHTSALPVFSTGELISEAYFRSGSALGVEGSVGLRVEVTRMFHLVATFEVTQYTLTITPRDGDPYVAARSGSSVGAIDRFMGGNASARLRF